MVEVTVDSDTESIGRIVDVVQVGNVQDERVQGIRVTLAAAAIGKEFAETRIRPVTDTGVRRTILNIKDWRKVGDGAQIKPTTLKFRPYGTQQSNRCLSFVEP